MDGAHRALWVNESCGFSLRGCSPQGPDQQMLMGLNLTTPHYASATIRPLWVCRSLYAVMILRSTTPSKARQEPGRAGATWSAMGRILRTWSYPTPSQDASGGTMVSCCRQIVAHRNSWGPKEPWFTSGSIILLPELQLAPAARRTPYPVADVRAVADVAFRVSSGNADEVRLDHAGDDRILSSSSSSTSSDPFVMGSRRQHAELS